MAATQERRALSALPGAAALHHQPNAGDALCGALRRFLVESQEGRLQR
ncbi:MAG: hypothetical protein ACYDFS_09170 [Vulcanimicrobiaceae bacterium]